MKTGECIAQGDVLIIKTTDKAVTKAHKPVARDRFGCAILALGESSGHKHLFRDPGVCLLAREGVGDRVITVENLCELLHDQGEGTFVPTGDHAPVTVPPGTYIVRTQREWVGQGVQNAID